MLPLTWLWKCTGHTASEVTVVQGLVDLSQAVGRWKGSGHHCDGCAHPDPASGGTVGAGRPQAGLAGRCGTCGRFRAHAWRPETLTNGRMGVSVNLISQGHKGLP